jgi:hypothetical protein
MNPQPQQPQAHRLHWVPVEPSWIIAAGLVLLAVLPHQVPRAGRRILQHPIGALVFAGLAAYIAIALHPVIGAAALIFVTGVWLSSPVTEGFAPVVLNKEKVDKKQHHSEAKQRWLNEEILSELPDAIQERSDNTYLNYDEVSPQESGRWTVEDVLGEEPTGIQDRAISGEPDSYDNQAHR